jgi:hypothetical protein
VDPAQPHQGEAPQPVAEGHAAAFLQGALQHGTQGSRGWGAAHGGPGQGTVGLILSPAQGWGTGSDCRASGALATAA